jgi:uridine kinase
MTQPKRSFVLAVCGPSGAGKSTLIRSIQQRRADVTSLALDEYESVSIYPDTAAWLAGGADPDQFQTPHFIADLRALAAGQAVMLPDQQIRHPAPLLLVEEPFGRERQEIAPLLDAVVYVQLPAEVALGRKLLRRNAFFPWEQDSARHLAHLHEFLTWYLQVGRAFAQAIEARVRPHCDLVLDGMPPAEELADTLIEWLHLNSAP